MKDIVIISIYDSGYGFSVMVDNKIYYQSQIKEDETYEEDTLADLVKNSYHNYNFEEWLKCKFPNKKIIICEDGGIEVLGE